MKWLAAFFSSSHRPCIGACNAVWKIMCGDIKDGSMKAGWREKMGQRAVNLAPAEQAKVIARQPNAKKMRDALKKENDSRALTINKGIN